MEDSPLSGRTGSRMPELTAQRTLVKSPPELWTELSDVESLARHLGEFGEIRITRSEPESVVAWEGENACGTVEIEASGWGTKVVMTALLPDAEPADEEPPAAYEDDDEEAGVIAVEPPELEPDTESEPESADAFEPGVEDGTESDLGESFEELEPEPRKAGLFARLFGRRKSRSEREAPAADAELPGAEPVPQPNPEPEPEPVPEPEPAGQNPDPKADPEPTTLDWGVPDIEWVQEELEPAPEADPQPGLAPDRAQAVLDATLDNLGSAHHRPFSRG